MSVIFFIIILAVLIIVHEYGHFIAAKKSGIRVDEFGLGFGPRITKLFRHKGTDFTLNALPFGGFVKIYGENPDDESVSGLHKNQALISKPRWVQAIVMFAGPFMNFAFAWLIVLVTLLSGFPTVIEPDMNPKFVTAEQSLVVSVMPESAAAVAGLAAGDRIESITVAGKQYSDISSLELRGLVAEHPTEPFTFVGTHEEVPLSVSVTPTPTVKEVGEGSEYLLGIGIERFGVYKPGPGRAFVDSFSFTGSMIANIARALWGLVSGAFTGNANVADLAGPIGIVGMVGDASRMGFAYVLSFAALISINLGIVNLIPFPALDGGRLLFLLIERIRGGRVNYQVQNVSNFIGFALLILLMLFVSYNDIARLL